MDKPAISVKNLRKWYQAKKNNVKAVDGVSFELQKGEILGVIGESGCGKSTLGRLLIRLEPPTDGEVEFNGQSADSLIKQDRMAFRRKVQMIFQNPFDTFDPRSSIEKILMTPLKLHKIGGSYEEQYKICLKLLEDAGLAPAKDYIDRFPHELSGGQLQRISILRSMLLNPEFVVADEPVSMLDVSIRADIINMLHTLAKEKGSAMVFISHDISTTRYISDRVAVMYLGRVVEIGKTDDVLHNPIHPYTRALISNCASLDPMERREVIILGGEPPTPINTGPGCYFEPRCYMREQRCHSQYPEMVDAGDGHFYSCFCTK